MRDDGYATSILKRKFQQLLIEVVCLTSTLCQKSTSHFHRMNQLLSATKSCAGSHQSTGEHPKTNCDIGRQCVKRSMEVLWAEFKEIGAKVQALNSVTTGMGMVGY